MWAKGRNQKTAAADVSHSQHEKINLILISSGQRINLPAVDRSSKELASFFFTAMLLEKILNDRFSKCQIIPKLRFVSPLKEVETALRCQAVNICLTRHSSDPGLLV